MKNQIKTLIIEDGQVRHVALNDPKVQRVAVRHKLVLRKLFIGIIKTSDRRACCGQEGRLLSAAGSKA